MRSLQDLLPKLKGFGAAPAVMAFDEAGMTTLAHAELEDRALRLAGGLLSRGLARGEPVALFAPNSAEWITAALAVLAAGGVVVPLDTRLARPTLAHELADSGAARVFTTRAGLEDLRAAVPFGQMLEPYLLDLAEDGEAGQSWAGLLGARPARLPELDGGETAALFYTSGTTGLPKGVPLTHANLLANLEGLGGAGLAAPGVRGLLPLPLNHVYPFVVGMLLILGGGAALVLPAGMSGPDIVQALKGAGATGLIGVPRLYEALMSAIRRRVAARGRTAERLFETLLGLSIRLRRHLGWRVGRLLFAPLHRALAPKLRVVSSGGAALDEALAWELEGLGWEVLTGYGLTETSPIITFAAAGRVGTAGQVLPGVELRCRPLPGMPGGEIQVRGPNVFSGYRNRPEADAVAFTEDGWFRTGDLGELDADGFLHILARVSETIVLPDGKNVYPEEVEEAYAGSPYIREVAVLEYRKGLAALAVPDVTAIHEARAGDAVEAVRGEVRRLSRDLPSYQRVTELRITHEALPRTTLGKLRRHLLGDLFQAAGRAPAAPAEAGAALSPADRDLLRAPLAQAVLAWLTERCPDRPVSLDADPQTDLGIDSLGWVSLTLELEQAQGVRLDETAIARVSSVRDLIEEALSAKERSFERGVLPPEELRWLAPTGPVLRLMAFGILVLVRLTLRLAFRLRVEGRERLPHAGPFVLAPNHASFLDASSVAAALPRRLFNETYWAGTTLYLFSSAPRRLFSRALHVFPVAAEHAAVSSLVLGAEVLRRGKVLAWFPEGRRSPDGRLQAFMPGIGRLVRDPEGLFVPVAIRGAFEAWPITRRFPRPCRVSITFGEPVTRRSLAELGEGESEDDRVADGLHRKLAALLAGGAAPPVAKEKTEVPAVYTIDHKE
jgi:long-chain acyl-CoA synthetase